VENLVSCTLYDWPSSWEGVLAARGERTEYNERIGYQEQLETNESPVTRTELIAQITAVRKELATAKRLSASKQYKVIDGSLYKIPSPPPDAKSASMTDEQIKKGQALETVEDIQERLEALMLSAKRHKEELIRPKRDRHYSIEDYKVADGQITTDPGAYGAWLHWDPQLWLDYENVVEILSQVAMFSLSMPVDTSGTYAWLLPVESRENSVELFCKMPKASVPPAVWIFSMILQSSTLPQSSRSTWYCETDRLSNLLGLRARYIRAAITRAAPTEQYGTY